MSSAPLQGMCFRCRGRCRSNQVRHCFLTHLHYLVNVLFHAVFSFTSDVDRDHQKHVRTLSRRGCEAVMQEDEARRRQPRLQPATVTQRLNTTRHAIMEQQHPMSPPRLQELAAGAQVDAARVRYVCPFSYRLVTQLTRSCPPGSDPRPTSTVITGSVVLNMRRIVSYK